MSDSEPILVKKAWREHDRGMEHHTFRDKSHFLDGYSVGDRDGQRAMLEKMEVFLFKQKHGVRAALDKLEVEVKDG